MSQIEAGEPSPHSLNTSTVNNKTISATGEGTKQQQQQRSETKPAPAAAAAGPPPSFSTQQLIRSFSEANVSELKQILNRTDADYGAYASGGPGGADDDRGGSRLHPVAESLFFALAECADIQVPRYLTEVVSFFCEHLRDEVERDVFHEVDNITHALKESCRGNPTNWLKSCARSLVLLGNIMQTVAGVDEDGAEVGDEDEVTDDDDGDEGDETQESSTAEADDELHRQDVTVDDDSKKP